MNTLKLGCPQCTSGKLIYCAVPEKSSGHYGNIPSKLGVCCDTCRTIFDNGDIDILMPWLIEQMKEIKKMLQEVYEMRQAQKEYFQHRTDMRLKISLARERRIDDLLSQFIKEGSIVVNYKPEQDQGNLFTR